MAKMSYTTISSATGDDDDHSIDVVPHYRDHPTPSYSDTTDDSAAACQDDEIATQSLQLRAAASDTSRNNGGKRCKYLSVMTVLCIVGAVLFGGKKYYLDENGRFRSFAGGAPATSVSSSGGGGGEDEYDWSDNTMGGGVRGSSNDLSIAQELFEGANDNGDGLVVRVKSAEEDEEKDEQDWEGGTNEEGRPPDYEDLEGEEEIENGLESISEGKTFDVDDEIASNMPNPEDMVFTEDMEEDNVSGDGSEPAEESAEELPDYFKPLTADERDALKQKLRSTLALTKASLLVSGTPGAHTPHPQRTFIVGTDTPKQFMHMHHMKTGGTSMDTLIQCALARQRELHNGTSINYNSMSECGSRVRQCMGELAKELNSTVVNNVFMRNDEEGHPIDDERFDPAEDALAVSVDDLNVCRTSEADVMSYCASLHTVRTFGWKDADKITVIRDPVDRAWSMYRFTLTSCYKCQELKTVLERVANGTFVSRTVVDAESEGEPNFVYDPNDSCAVQMIGHQATNLLSSIDLYNLANDVRFPVEQVIVDEAVRNLREEFTWIGLTDRLEETVSSFREVFPFLAENLTEAALQMSDKFDAKGAKIDDNRFALPEGYVDTKGCAFPHANGGRAPTCGTKKLDDEIIHLIKKLNNRDVAVYKAAVERFELQMEVLEEYRASL